MRKHKRKIIRQHYGHRWLRGKQRKLWDELGGSNAWWSPTVANVGYKGKQTIDAGIYYAPYIPTTVAKLGLFNV